MRRDQALAMAKLARPFVLVAMFLAFFTGACMAHWRLDGLPLPSVVAGLLITLFATLMGHYANEYADFDTDTITRRTRFSGGSGVLPSGIVPPSWALYAALAFLTLAVLMTAGSFASGAIGLETVALVAIGLPLGWFYSMPPLRLERTWLGELDNSLLGCLMMLMGYVPATSHMDAMAMAISLPLFLAIFANLLGVHWPDREADRAVGKRTMAVALGQRTKMVFAVAVLAIYPCLVLAHIWAPAGAVLAGLLTAPVAAWAIYGFWTRGAPHYGSVLMGALFVFMGVGFLLSP